MLEALADSNSAKIDECNAKLAECESRLYLLAQSEKSYQAVTSDEDGDNLVIAHSDEKIVPGKLTCKIISATGLSGKKSSKSSTFATIQVDHVQKAHTRPGSGTWGETFTIGLDRSSDIEIAIYEQENVNLLGLVWFSPQDMFDALCNSTPKSPTRHASMPNLDGSVIFSLDLVPGGRVVISLKFGILG